MANCDRSTRNRLAAAASLLGFLAIFASPSAVLGQAEGGLTLREIRIEGSERVDPSTVKSYMTINPGDPFDIGRVNQSLKALYATGLFSDVQMRREGSALVVTVAENPVINRIAFEGNNRIKDDVLLPEVQLKPRQVFTRAKVQSDVKRIVDVYRRNGRFQASVEPKIIRQPQNRVDLVFEVNEGDSTGVRRIIFVGNEKYSDSQLREIIQTRQSRWWAFYRANDTFDADRLAFDRELLRRHYLESGYADFKILSAIAELAPDREDFFLTFTLQEGERYRFGEAKVATTLRNVDAVALQKEIRHDAGSWYNSDLVEKSISAITDQVGTFGYAFVEVKPKVEKDEQSRIVNITYEIGEGPKVFVERIDIRGNSRTQDRVIRREFRLAEGDAFNTSKMRRSKQRIQNLGFFSKVDVKTVQGSSPERTVVEVDVEEQSTGELSFGIGFSTADGVLGDISIRERNLMGKGQELRLGFTGSAASQQIDLGFTEPYFLDRPISAGFDVFRTTTDYQDTSSYDESQVGARLRSGYRINDSLTQNWRYTLRQVEVSNVGSDASLSIKEIEGSRIVSEVGHSILFDERDNRFMATSGYFLRMSNDIAGLGGSTRYAKNRIDGAYFYTPFDKVTLAVTGELGYAHGLGDTLVASDRYFLGGTKVRGFKNSGIGPRDTLTGDALGGDKYYAGSVELRFPLGLPPELGVSGRAFIDGGSLWGLPSSGANIKDEHALRASTGLGVAWTSPFGPITLDYGFPFLKQDYDELERLRVSFGTNF